MNTNKLHIVSFDIPYPATYGGAIDVFYRIKALHQLGIKITLHCTYKDQLTHYNELESLCDKVYYYHRHMSFKSLFSTLPIAVAGRKNDEILKNLLCDNAPILYEGLMSCGTLADKRLLARRKYFRECNVEHDYYRGLAKATNSWKKFYYLLEAHRLQRFEKKLKNATAILSLAHQDERHFKEKFPQIPTIYLPCFHSNSSISSVHGIGEGILYHGNLEVPENLLALNYILKQITPQLPDIPFVIAGRCNSNKLQKIVSHYPNVILVPNPNEAKMLQLIHDAQINLLITFQGTGLKLKLLNVLYAGRHVICNNQMISGTELAALCYIENVAETIIQRCRSLINKPLTDSDIAHRKEILSTFDNEHLANILSGIL